MAELGLGQPDIARHTLRDGIAETGCFLGPVGGTLGKLATDVKLMMQTEVAEVFEPFAPGRGSSSTMPQKRNPVSCIYIHAAVAAARPQVAALLEAMVAEHERSAGPWQIEWVALPVIFCLTAGALAQARFLVSGLEVDAGRMRANPAVTHGLIVSEAVMMGLAPISGGSRPTTSSTTCAAGRSPRSGRWSTCWPRTRRSSAMSTGRAWNVCATRPAIWASPAGWSTGCWPASEGQALSRSTISKPRSTIRWSTGSPATRASSSSAARAPIARDGIRTVVSAGDSSWAISRSPSPATASRSGTETPNERHSSKAPTASTSLAQKAASTSGASCSRARSARRPAP